VVIPNPVVQSRFLSDAAQAKTNAGYRENRLLIQPNRAGKDIIKIKRLPRIREPFYIKLGGYSQE
jgi:hypothetical protein